MNRLPERIEAHCPHCHAAFVLPPGALRRKLQCPKCRQTVAIGLVEERPAGNLPTAEEFAGLHTRLAQQAALIEELRAPHESPAEIPAPKPPPGTPPSDSLLGPGQSLRWLRRDAHTWSAAYEDVEQRALLLHNLRAMGRRDLTIETVRDDHLSHSLADHLTAIFREAGWSVREAPPFSRPQRAHGLIISAGQCPLPHAATAAYMALKAAGFPIISRLDGTLGPTDSILIAGSTSESAGDSIPRS